MTKEDKKTISQKDVMTLLNNCYLKVNEGIPHISQPVQELAKNYLDKKGDILSAAKSLVNAQVTKCATSGFVTSFGGFITMPITIPANIGSVLYVQMRMIGAIATMAGYDLSSDQVQTLIYSCLAGVALTGIAKKTIQQFGMKYATTLINKIPKSVIIKINQKVGYRFLTKMGTKGTVNLITLVPGISAIIGAAFDGTDTKLIGERAIRWFIKGDFSVKAKKSEDVIVIDCNTGEESIN